MTRNTHGWTRRLSMALDALFGTPSSAASPPQTPARAGARPLVLQNTAGRDGVLLNGDWSVIVDPVKVGSVSPFEGFPPVAFQSARPWSNDLVLQEWAFDPDTTLRTPGDWNTQQERLFFYEGDVWYARPVAHSRGEGVRLFVHFGAVNYRADVWWNGSFVGFHEGGFTPFAFEVTHLAKDGENQLVVRVRNELGPDTVPTRFTDWHNYGGITRDVRLVRTPSAFIRDYHIRLLDPATGEAEADVFLDGAEPGQEVHLSLPELQETVSANVDGSGRVNLKWRTRARLWSPASPTLYLVSLASGSDRIEDRIGFRTVSVAGQDILLNGEPIFLRGVSAHEESVLHPGRASGPEDARATLELVKRLNGNFLRLAHYPHDEATTRMADEMGILIWSEMPIYWGIHWDGAETLASALAQTRAMVERDRNRASVILWSIANETPQTEARLQFLTEVANEVRSADPHRPLTAALFGNPLRYARQLAQIIAARLVLDEATAPDQRRDLLAYLARLQGAEPDPAALVRLSETAPQIRVDDPLGEIVDVIGFNQYVGWYYEASIAGLMPATEAQVRRVSLDLMPRTQIRSALPRPLVISEFGADATPGHRGPTSRIFTEDFQAEYYRRQLQMIAQIPNLRGVSPWVLKDFRAPRRTLPRYLDYWNRKGLVDEKGTPKLAFEVLRSAYAPDGVFGNRP